MFFRWGSVFGFLLLCLLYSINGQGIESYIELNVYLVLDERATTKAEELNINITYALPFNELHFYDNHLPHITLYQTSFDQRFIQTIIETLQNVLENFNSCTVVLNGGATFAGFIEWKVEENPCLENISRDIAEALKTYRQLSQPIPSWVVDYPNPVVRQAMTDTFIFYGYPFVEQTFRAGITVGYDTRGDLVKNLVNFPALSFVPKAIEIAVAGKNDQVFRDQIVFTFPI